MKRKGFTLIEMIIVLFIISLLVLIIIPNLSAQKKHAKSVHGSAMVSVIQSQVESYFDESKDGNITISKLNAKNYLTDKQVRQAMMKTLLSKIIMLFKNKRLGFTLLESMTVLFITAGILVILLFGVSLLIVNKIMKKNFGMLLIKLGIVL